MLALSETHSFRSDHYAQFKKTAKVDIKTLWRSINGSVSNPSIHPSMYLQSLDEELVPAGKHRLFFSIKGSQGVCRPAWIYNLCMSPGPELGVSQTPP